MTREHNADVHRHEEWDADVEPFVQLIHASLVILQPSPDFQARMREHLAQAAADLAGQPQKSAVPRLLLVGAAAAVSLVGAGAGAAWWLWKTRPHTLPLGAFLPARGS